MAGILINLARIRWHQADTTGAAELLEEARERLRASPASPRKASSLLSLGILYSHLADSASTAHRGGYRVAALEVLGEAGRRDTGAEDNRLRSYVRGYLGHLYQQAGRLDEALSLTRQAIFLAQESQADDALYRWLWQAARLFKAQGQSDRSLRSYRQAVRTLVALRQRSIGRRDGEVGVPRRIAQDMDPLFRELVDALLSQRAGKTDEATLQEARQTMERLKVVELDNYFQDECVTALQARTRGIDRLQPHTAVLYPIILPDRTELLLTMAGGTRRYTARVSSSELTQTVDRLRALLEKRTTRQYLPYASRLYDWLARPLEPALAEAEIDTLVFVPDRVLRTIPLAALYDGHDFLNARFAIATSPGLTLTDPKGMDRLHPLALLAGLSLPVQGFTALPSVSRELRDIKASYAGDLLQDQQFSTANLRSEVDQKSFSIVHMATHGRFDRDVRKSFLLTYDGRVDMDDLAQMIGGTTFRKKPVELLALSACQTAAGDEGAALGLAGIAVKSGARSALATLWSVNDEASATLVSGFYRELRNPSWSKAQALQGAQRALMADRRYRHPAYWSPFLLIGNWL